jgi:hypothetical protein
MAFDDDASYFTFNIEVEFYLLLDLGTGSNTFNKV